MPARSGCWPEFVRVQIGSPTPSFLRAVKLSSSFHAMRNRDNEIGNQLERNIINKQMDEKMALAKPTFINVVHHPHISALSNPRDVYQPQPVLLARVFAQCSVHQ